MGQYQYIYLFQFNQMLQITETETRQEEKRAGRWGGESIRQLGGTW